MSSNRGKPTSSAASSRRQKRRQPSRDETDSFIDEVTEELQRDRLNRSLRRYGPYGVAAIVLIIVGVAGYEYYKTAQASAAQEVGAAFVEAENAEDPATAFSAIAENAEGGAAMLARFRAADAHEAAGDTATAISLYEAIAADADADTKFRDLAVIKSAMAQFDSAEPGAIIAMLEPLTQLGAPYRPLALELTAGAMLKSGDGDAARDALREAVATPNAPQNVTLRVSALLETLGENADQVDADQVGAPPNALNDASADENDAETPPETPTQ